MQWKERSDKNNKRTEDSFKKQTEDSGVDYLGNFYPKLSSLLGIIRTSP